MGGVVGVADTIERRESPRGVRGEGGGERVTIGVEREDVGVEREVVPWF